jgi:hypothetical protein
VPPLVVLHVQERDPSARAQAELALILSNPLPLCYGQQRHALQRRADLVRGRFHRDHLCHAISRELRMELRAIEVQGADPVRSLDEVHTLATAGEMFRSWTDADLPLTP